MLIVVADTGPLRYLVQIDQIQLLPRLFEKILIPSVVSEELRHPSAPEVVRDWMRSRPDWLEVSVVNASDDPSLRALDDGEKSAIALGLSVSADLILIDDRRGATAARDKGLEVSGTLGILDLAARRGMIDLANAIARLRTTNFRRREELFDALLKQHKRGGQS
jgi:predicted nucleic acid-binding protein